MKKFLALTLALATLTLSACSSSDTESSVEGKIVVGATSVPHAEILNEAVSMLEEKGITLQVVEFSDYTTINKNLVDNEMDANYFQHTAYLENFNSDSGSNLVSVGGVHIEPIGLYSNSITSLSELKDGDTIAISNNATDNPRALKLLAENGVITLDPSVENPTVYDIIENPNNIEFIDMEPATLPRTLDDVTASVINTNYALEANLNPMNDAIIMEGEDSIYVNVLAVRSGDENKEEVLALYEVLTSPEITKFIIDTYEGAVVPVS